MLRVLQLWLPVILWSAIILSAANDEFSNANTKDWLAPLFGDLAPVANTIFRKGGHLAAYAVLALLAWRAHRTLFIALFVSMAVAFADESLQSMTLTREGSPFDVLLDVCGAVLGLICVPAVRERLSSRRRAG